MDYRVEFERLLGYAKQGLSGVDVEKREVLGFTGLGDVVKDYENRLAEKLVNDCSYSPDKKHDFDGDICIYCEGRREKRSDIVACNCPRCNPLSSDKYYLDEATE